MDPFFRFWHGRGGNSVASAFIAQTQKHRYVCACFIFCLGTIFIIPMSVLTSLPDTIEHDILTPDLLILKRLKTQQVPL